MSIQRGIGILVIASRVLARNARSYAFLMILVPGVLAALASAVGGAGSGHGMIALFAAAAWALPVVIEVTSQSLESGGRASLTAAMPAGFIRFIPCGMALFGQLALTLLLIMLTGVLMLEAFTGMMQSAPWLLAWMNFWMVAVLAVPVAIGLASWYLIVGTFAGRAGMARGFASALAAPFRAPGEHLVVHLAAIMMGTGVCIASKTMRSAFATGASNPLALEPDLIGTLVVGAPVILFVTVCQVLLARSASGRPASV